MIQRKQTLYLLAALIVTIVCLCLPIASLKASGMEVDSIVTNLWIHDNTGYSFKTSPLFVLLHLTCPLTLLSIFKYHQRLFQAKLCVINAVLIIFWGAYYAFFYATSAVSITLHFATCLPVIALILHLMARHAILADEKLVRAADRIR